ncbi:MAG TPA: hypothetical protein VGR11_17055 [Solirubrobacteraceae bacterium]|nr:hypothetical protein [Solirubrobacteraceae bacterium]
MASLASRALSARSRRIGLRSALKLDALVTGANGGAYLVAAQPLGDLLGLSAVVLRALGVVLLAFGAVLWLSAARPSVARGVGVAVVVANAAWALASIAVAVGGWMSPTAIGTLWIIIQAIVVAGFAELQAAALRH